MYARTKCVCYCCCVICFMLIVFKSFISLLTFCLVVLYVIMNGTLNFPLIFIEMLISPIRHARFFFMYFGDILILKKSFYFYLFLFNKPRFLSTSPRSK